MDNDAIELYYKLWPAFFPKDAFVVHDSRLSLSTLLFDFFKSPQGQELFPMLQPARQWITRSGSILLDIQELSRHLPFDDVESILKSKPREIIACFSLAISRLANTFTPFVSPPIVINVQMCNLSTQTPFADVKTESVGQLVSVEGHVVRVSVPRPLLISGGFRCAKCQNTTFSNFEDGIFTPPQQCGTKKCYNKLLDFDRSTVVMGDYHQVKITEVEDFLPSDLSLEQLQEQQQRTLQQGGAFTPRTPRNLELEMRGPLVNLCLAGDVVRVVGIVQAMQLDVPRSARFGGGSGRGAGMKESGLHQLYILANSVECIKSSGDRDAARSRSRSQSRTTASSSLLQRTTVHEFSREELMFIRSIALSPHCVPLLIHSFCDLIFGHEIVKLGILLGVIGGSDSSAEKSTIRDSAASHKNINVRENIHVLIVGDPGLGKSQLLRSAAAIAPRAVYVCGNTSTAAGLTVSLTRDGSQGGNGHCAIEAGALVLADRGVCFIDEFDKLTCDVHSLLEAMEQQSVSVAKAGVVASLRCRSAVIAAANPVGGHYNRSKSVCENLKMSSALLSRFDLVFILLDEPDEDRDTMISEHILGMDSQSFSSSNSQHDSKRQRLDLPAEGGSTDANSQRTLAQRLRFQIRTVLSLIRRNPRLRLLAPDQMRRYFEYAQRYVHPKLSRGAAKVLQKMYLTLRSDCGVGGGNALPVTTRHLESLIRLAQARARLELRDIVTNSDAEDVVSLLQESSLDVFADSVGLIDCSKRGGQSMGKQIKALASVMNKEAAARENKIFHRNDIETLIARLRLTKDVDDIIETMKIEGYLLVKGPKLYMLQSA